MRFLEAVGRGVGRMPLLRPPQTAGDVALRWRSSGGPPVFVNQPAMTSTRVTRPTLGNAVSPVIGAGTGTSRSRLGCGRAVL